MALAGHRWRGEHWTVANDVKTVESAAPVMLALASHPVLSPILVAMAIPGMLGLS